MLPMLPLSAAVWKDTTPLDTWEIFVLTTRVILAVWGCLHSAPWEVTERYISPHLCWTVPQMPVPEAPLQVTLPAPHPDVPCRVLSNHRDGSALDLACSSDRKLKNNKYFTIWLGICTMGEWKPDACTVGSQWSRAIWC